VSSGEQALTGVKRMACGNFRLWPYVKAGSEINVIYVRDGSATVSAPIFTKLTLCADLLHRFSSTSDNNADSTPVSAV
jgi:hypothetical protein